MPLSAGRVALKAALKNLANNEDVNAQDAMIDDFITALENYIKTSTITLNPLGLVAPPSGGPVTGTATSILT